MVKLLIIVTCFTYNRYRTLDVGGSATYGDIGIDRPCSDYTGSIIIENQDGTRMESDGHIYSYLAEGEPYCYRLIFKRKIQGLKPILITNDDDLRVIYNGLVTCSFNEEINDNLKERISGNFATSSDAWFGIMQFGTSGLFTKRKSFHLIAVGEKDACVRNGDRLYSSNKVNLFGSIIETKGVAPV